MAEKSSTRRTDSKTSKKPAAKRKPAAAPKSAGKPASASRARTSTNNTKPAPSKPAAATRTERAAGRIKSLVAGKPVKPGAAPALKSSAAPRSKPTAVTAIKPGGANAHRSNAARIPAIAPVPAEPPRKMDSGLHKKDIELFQQMLNEKRTQLVRDLNNMQRDVFARNPREASGDLSSMPLHMADLGTDNYEQEFTLGLIEGEQGVLREIDDALARIEKKTYGVCQATGKPIGKARLRAKPWAKFCYEYELAQERGRVRRL